MVWPCPGLPGRCMRCSAVPLSLTGYFSSHLLRLRASVGEALIIAFFSKVNSKEYSLRASSVLLKTHDGMLCLSL